MSSYLVPNAAGKFHPDKPYSQITDLDLFATWLDIKDDGLLRWHAREREGNRIMDELHKRQLCLVQQNKSEEVGYKWGVVVIKSDEDRSVYPDDVPREITDVGLAAIIAWPMCLNDIALGGIE